MTTYTFGSNYDNSEFSIQKLDIDTLAGCVYKTAPTQAHLKTETFNACLPKCKSCGAMVYGDAKIPIEGEIYDVCTQCYRNYLTKQAEYIETIKDLRMDILELKYEIEELKSRQKNDITD